MPVQIDVSTGILVTMNATSLVMLLTLIRKFTRMEYQHQLMWSDYARRKGLDNDEDH